MPSSHVKVSGVWKKVNKTYVKVAGVWKEVLNTYVKVGGEWKKTSSSGGSLFIFDQTISADTNNYNLKNAAIAAGWNETDPLQASVTINSGVVVSSVLSTGIAFDTGSGFPDGSVLSLTNNGTIRGKGGAGGYGGLATLPLGNPENGQAGGTALRVQYPCSISNTGAIQGGGGGGGGGQSIYVNGSTSTRAAGGGGGGGAGEGEGGSSGGVSYGNNGADGTTQPAGDGVSGNATTGGSYGLRGRAYRAADSDYTIWGGAGGVGGGLGQAGTNGGGTCTTNTGSVPSPYLAPTNTSIRGGTKTLSGSSTGGAGGAAVQGNSAITWLTTGTRTGSINA